MGRRREEGVTPSLRYVVVVSHCFCYFVVAVTSSPPRCDLDAVRPFVNQSAFVKSMVQYVSVSVFFYSSRCSYLFFSSLLSPFFPSTSFRRGAWYGYVVCCHGVVWCARDHVGDLDFVCVLLISFFFIMCPCCSSWHVLPLCVRGHCRFERSPLEPVLLFFPAFSVYLFVFFLFSMTFALCTFAEEKEEKGKSLVQTLPLKCRRIVRDARR